MAGKCSSSGAAPGERQAATDATRSWGHMGVLFLGEGNGMQWGAGGASTHLLRSCLNFHPDLAFKGQQRPGSRQAWGCLAYGSCYPATDSKTSRGTMPSDCRQHPSPGLWRLAPQGNIKRQGKQQRAPLDTCPQKPSPEYWACRHNLHYWSCHCHAAVCDHSSQRNPPTLVLLSHLRPSADKTFI